jgi:hypothetical protein
MTSPLDNQLVTLTRALDNYRSTVEQGDFSEAKAHLHKLVTTATKSYELCERLHKQKARHRGSD